MLILRVEGQCPPRQCILPPRYKVFDLPFHDRAPEVDRDIEQLAKPGSSKVPDRTLACWDTSMRRSLAAGVVTCRHFLGNLAERYKDDTAPEDVDTLTVLHGLGEALCSVTEAASFVSASILQ